MDRSATLASDHATGRARVAPTDGGRVPGGCRRRSRPALFVAGEAGVGKTTFVRHVLQDAAGGARAATGMCDGSSTPAPLAPLLEMLPELPADVWPPDVPRHEMFARLVAALRAPPTPEPYLLVVEDAHWADEATVDLLRHLARRVHTTRALVLVTYRPEDAPDGSPLRMLMGEAATAAGVRRLDVGPLSPAGVRRAGRRPRPRSSDARPAGPPVTAREPVLRHRGARRRRRRAAADERARRRAGPGRPALGRGPPGGRGRVIAGPRAEVGLLEALLGDDVLALDEPLERDVLRLVDGVVTFRHELARRAVWSTCHRSGDRAPRCARRAAGAGRGRPGCDDKLRTRAIRRR